MQKLNSLTLPKEFPIEKVMKSWNQNLHNYEPEFWEFQYEIVRYLKNVNNAVLEIRYRDICDNFEVLTSPVRNKIPIHSFLSSWYWYRKEHLTRYEFYLRNIQPPVPTPNPRPPFQALFRAKGPNSSEILFRYGERKHMKAFIEKGSVRITLASKYKDGPVNDPRTDDEINKNRWLTGNHTTITNEEGKRIPIRGDVKETISTPDYYTLCTSCDFEPKMFKKLPYDSCVIIKNPEQFAKRIEQSANIILPGWYFHYNPIEYYDPYEPTENQYFEPTMIKEFSSAYQMEYRFLWFPLENNSGTIKHIDLNLGGSLEDICELYTID